MPTAPISPKVKEILKDSKEGRKLVKEVRERNPDKNGHITIYSTQKKSSKKIRT
ncbi:hypothetical protein ES708_16246 [subsurface metagenome]